jgi:hypothetical protein
MIILATCNTENCGNAGAAIPLEDPADLIVCGVCNQEITDKQEGTNERQTEA